ncbi:MAG: ATP-binding protein [Crenarchaeota archaeon]|nr:ATP-binding protein [Thermoproteota archaeon]
MLRDVILNQKNELKRVQNETYIERDIEPFSFEHNLIKIVTGPRRAGKSFFILHTLKKTKNFGYANFDNEALVTLNNYDDLIAEIERVYEKPEILFFDEIQNLPRWELFVNRLQRQGYNIVITGSNSKLLSNELATHLTGRHIPTTVLTFSLKEYLRARNIDLEKLTINQRENMLLDYIQSGGYPETILKKLDTNQYLEILFESILYKDIIKRYHLRKGPDIEKLATYLLSNLASEVSYFSLAKAIGIKSSITIQKYCNFLEEAYLIFTIDRFSYKTKQSKQNKKMYCYDNGLIKAKAFQASPNIGKLFENCIAIHLKRKEIEKQIELYYWRNQQGQEVDFVIKKGTKIHELIQVCYKIENEKTKQREIRALLNAAKELNCNKLTILTLRENKTEQQEWYGNKATITYIPFEKWLLKK